MLNLFNMLLTLEGDNSDMVEVEVLPEDTVAKVRPASDDKDAGSPGDDRICKRLGDSVMVGSCCGCGCRCNMFVHGELVPPDPMTDTGC